MKMDTCFRCKHQYEQGISIECIYCNDDYNKLIPIEVEDDE